MTVEPAADSVLPDVVAFVTAALAQDHEQVITLALDVDDPARVLVGVGGFLCEVLPAALADAGLDDFGVNWQRMALRIAAGDRP